MTFADVADLYLEEIDEENKTYLVDGKKHPIKQTVEQIKIYGKDEPELFTILETHRGPILDSIFN